MTLLVFLLMYSHSSLAQRDIFNWELSAYGGLISDGTLEVPSESSLFASGMRIQKNLGSAWQLGLHVGHFNFGEITAAQRSYSGLGLAYNWDNGTLLHKRAFISPYHIIETGYLAEADFNDKRIDNEAAALGLENGLKFRIGDRATAHLAYAMFWEVDRDGVNETFDRTVLNLWKVGVSLHFGAKKVRFRGPTFDAASRFSPVHNAGLTPAQPLAASTPTPSPQTQVISRIDTVYSFRVDTVYKVVRESVFIDSTGTPRYAMGVSEREYKELQDRLVFLEGFMEGKSRKDSTIIVYRTEYQQAALDEPKQKTAPAERERSMAQQPIAQRSAEAAPAVYDADPVIVAMLQRQEELIKTQNAMLREMNARSAQPLAVDQRRGRAMQTRVSPTIMVPLNDPGSKRDDERVALLEEQVKRLEERLEAQSTPTPVKMVAAAQPVPVVSHADTIAAVNELVESADRIPVTKLSADSIAQRAAEIKLKADEIAQASAAAEAAPPTPTTSPPAKLKAEYPAVFLFGLNRDDVDDSYEMAFDNVAADLKADPKLNVIITGFTDKSGNADYNKKLSARRAASIKGHLLERGVPASQIKMRGEGQAGAADKFSPGDRRVEVELTEAGQ